MKTYENNEKNALLTKSDDTLSFFNYILNIISNFTKGVPPQEKEVKVSKKLYVSNIPFTVTEDDLKDLFETCGTVTESKIIKYRDTGKSRGFGFVEMETEEQAQGAINLINGRELQGRTLNVDEAKETPNGKPASFKRAKNIGSGTCALCGNTEELYAIEDSANSDTGVCTSCIKALSFASRPPRKPRTNYNYNNNYNR